MQQQQQQPDNDFEKIREPRRFVDLLQEMFDLLIDLMENYSDLMITLMLLVLKVFSLLFLHRWQVWKKILRWAYVVLLVLCAAYQAWSYVATGSIWHLLIALLDYVALILVVWTWKKK